MGKAHTLGIVALAILVAAVGLTTHRKPAISSAPPPLIFVQGARDGGRGVEKSVKVSLAPRPSYLVAASSNKQRLTVLTPKFVAVRDPEVSFDGRMVLFAGKRTLQDRWQVWEVRCDGKRLRQVTHERGDCAQPHYLPEGRILYTCGEDDANALYTSDADGSNVVRITFNLQPVDNTSVLPDGRILFSIRRGGASLPARWLTVNSDGTGIAPFAGNADTQYAIRNEQYVPAAPRSRPKGHTSVVDEKKKTGMLFCLNACLSHRPGPSPALRTGPDALPAGTFMKLRVWAATPKPRVLGEVSLEKDGSFSLEVPADTPLRLETLDAGNKVVMSQQTWIWVRHNEKRGCIGCHEDKELAPDNQLPMAIAKPPAQLVN
jgi:hypothetical protein